MKRYEKQLMKNAAKDLIVEPIENVFEKYLPLQKIYYHFKERNFCKFLEQLYKDLELNKKLSREEVDQLIEEVSKSETKQYMATILDTLCFSKGLYASQILALITSKYMSEDDLDYCDLILISALKDLYDDDLNAFVHVFMHNQQTADSVSILDNYGDNERIILDKLQNLNILGKDRTPGRFSDGKSKPLFYEKTEVSKRLFSYCAMIIKAYL